MRRKLQFPSWLWLLLRRKTRYSLFWWLYTYICTHTGRGGKKYVIEREWSLSAPSVFTNQLVIFNASLWAVFVKTENFFNIAMIMYTKRKNRKQFSSFLSDFDNHIIRSDIFFFTSFPVCFRGIIRVKRSECFKACESFFFFFCSVSLLGWFRWHCLARLTSISRAGGWTLTHTPKRTVKGDKLFSRTNERSLPHFFPVPHFREGGKVGQ